MDLKSTLFAKVTSVIWPFGIQKVVFFTFQSSFGVVEQVFRLLFFSPKNNYFCVDFQLERMINDPKYLNYRLKIC